MLLQQVSLVVVEGQQAAFEGALLEVRQRVFMSAGFRGLTVAQGAEHPTGYLVQIRWESLDELAAAADRFDRAWAPVQPFLAGPLRVDHFVERPTLDFQGPGVLTDLAWLHD